MDDDRAAMPQFLPRPGRRDIEVPVEILADDGVHSGTTRNMSPGGMFVATDRIGRVGDRVGVRLELPGLKAPVSVSAEIRWVRPKEAALAGTDLRPGIGIKFVDLHLWTAAFLTEFLEKLA